MVTLSKLLSVSPAFQEEAKLTVEHKIVLTSKKEVFYCEMTYHSNNYLYSTVTMASSCTRSADVILGTQLEAPGPNGSPCNCKTLQYLQRNFYCSIYEEWEPFSLVETALLLVAGWAFTADLVTHGEKPELREFPKEPHRRSRRRNRLICANSRLFF